MQKTNSLFTTSSKLPAYAQSLRHHIILLLSRKCPMLGHHHHSVTLLINMKPLFLFLLHSARPCHVHSCKFYTGCRCSDTPNLLSVGNWICSVQNIKSWLIFVTSVSEHKPIKFSELSGTLQSKINKIFGPSMLNLKASAVSLLKSGELQWLTRINSTWNLLNSH